MTQEEARLAADRDRTAHWKRWGPYLSERQWGTVREDYSSTGEAWDYLPHDAMTAELSEVLIDVLQRWLEQDCDPPICRLKKLTRSVSGADLAELKAILEQELTTYQDAGKEACKRWQHSLEIRGHQGQLVSTPLLAEIKAKYSLERLKKQIDGDALAIYSDWCDQRGWTDLFVNESRFWAFPPGAVLPFLVGSISLL